LARDIRALGATLIVVGADAAAYAGIAQHMVVVDLPGEAAAALLMPAQMFAYFSALRRGQSPDAPANLSKVVILQPAP